MYEYKEPYKTCDRILEEFTAEKPQGLDHADIQRLLGYNNQNQGYVSVALTKLLDDGHLTKYGSDDRFFKLGGDALIFKENGGYKEQLKNEKRDNELRTLLNETNLKVGDSVIKTNDLVHTNTKKQEKLTRAALLIAAASAIISLFGLFKDFLKTDIPKQLQIPATDSILQKTSQTIDTLNQNLYRIDYSLKALKDSLTNTYKKN
jgi:hypothetical protein